MANACAASGPDVDVGAAAGELPALCAIRIDSSRSGSRSPTVNEAGGSPARSFQHRRDLRRAPLLEAVAGKPRLLSSRPATLIRKSAPTPSACSGHAIQLLDELNAGQWPRWTLVDARWTPEGRPSVSPGNGKPA